MRIATARQRNHARGRTWALVALLLGAPLGAWAAKDSCLECHSNLEGNLAAPAAVFKDDVHSQRGFGCADCHGGDRTTDDMEASMNRARGFRGKFARKDIPQMCAHCHSDANLIHKFRPQQRVDQLAQYQTSVHGKRLAAGDTSVATCIDCHSVHNIREVRHPLSPVHPLRLPETCAKCHADRALMEKYKIDATQFSEYRRSVHWDAVSKRGDLSAPTCATCHGNHGATPPQVSSVAAVCGSCHVLLEDLFRKSPHQPAFASMGMAGCIVCHGKHEIHKPSPKMLAGNDAVCAQCHDAASKGGAAAAEMAKWIGGLSEALERSDAILAQARRSGMEVSEALLKQNDARENLVKARVAVHAFNVAAVAKPADDGVKIAAETYRAGETALKERDFRRFGLTVSMAAILLTIAGLWLAIRSIESKTAPEAGGR